MKFRHSVKAFVLALAATLACAPAFATLQYTGTHRSAAATDLVTAIGATGYLMILSGSQPANVATVDAGTVIVAMPLSSTAGTVSAGVLTFNSITATAATASATGAHFLICSSSVTATCVAVSSTTRIAQGSVGTSGADLNFAGGVVFTSGTTVSITSWTWTMNGA